MISMSYSAPYRSPIVETKTEGPNRTLAQYLCHDETNQQIVRSVGGVLKPADRVHPPPVIAALQICLSRLSACTRAILSVWVEVVCLSDEIRILVPSRAFWDLAAWRMVKPINVKRDPRHRRLACRGRPPNHQ